MLCWNVGGAAIGDLPRALGEAASASLREEDIVCLQELPRGEPGWQSHCYEHLKLVSHREENQWRGAGVAYSERMWTVMRRIQSECGVWLRLRHLVFSQELWVGSLYVKPDCNQVEHERRVAAHLDGLPPTHLPVLLGCDLNSPITWARARAGDLRATARTGKSNQFLNQFAARDLQPVAHSEEQMEVPTSRPRQQDRQGRIIDLIASARVMTKETEVHVNSHKVLGTDHELISTKVVFAGVKGRGRPNTKPRVVTKAIPEILELDQQEMVKLAKEHTGVKPGAGYKDPPSVKALFNMARFSKCADDWKKAFAERRKEKTKHKQNLVEAVAKGEWSGYRKLKSGKTVEWECHFAESQEGDPHKSIHEHLEGIYGNSPPDLTDFQPEGSFEPISPEELQTAIQQGKRGKSVGEDGTSLELVEGIAQAVGGESAILTWFNEILQSGQLPEDWFSALMIILPKTAKPTQPRQLRPICLSSSVSKVFCRILLNRAKSQIRPLGSAQCAGPGKQSIDYVYAIHKLLSLEREWKGGLCFLKVDLEKAFDCVSKPSLMSFIKSKLGKSPEARCWQRLLNRSEAHLHRGQHNSAQQRDKTGGGRIPTLLYQPCRMDSGRHSHTVLLAEGRSYASRFGDHRADVR